MILIIPIHKLDQELTEELLNIWEASVRATHTFLSEMDITELRPQVREALPQLEQLTVAYTARGAVAFLGIDGDKVEMLFVHPQQRHQGLGRQLMAQAIQEQHIRYVDVNEQNPQAAGFYEHLGFRVIDRSPLDNQGRPFPILHMALT